MSKKKSKAVTPPAPRRSWTWRLLAGVPTLMVVLLIGWAGLFLLVAPKLPDTDELFRESDQRSVTLLASDGSRLAMREGSNLVRLDQIAPVLVSAVLATEDHRFYRHFGLDVMGLGRAVWRNLVAGDVVAGGSTITQQLAKNLFLTSERSIRRKAEELALAIWLESRLSKKEILTLYMNRVYLGAGSYGFEAAARRYFGKPASSVDLSEAAMLAGLLKAPSALAPTSNIERARDRATIVLGRMVDVGVISQAQAEAAKSKPARLAPETATDLAGHFLDWVVDDLTTNLGQAGRDLVVRTTLDRRAQIGAENALRTVLARDGVARRVGEGAVVLLDSSGAVRAMVGGESYRTSRLNRATQAKRQPGSAFKPFLYLAALEQGMSPSTQLDDRPVAIRDWRPANFDGKYLGRVSMEEAFAQSLNSAAVRLIQQVGPQKVVATAHRLGIASSLQAVPSLALGTSEVTLLELTSAYLPFATGGLRRQVFAVTEVADDRGRVLYRYVPQDKRVIEARAATSMQAMLRATVERGTGKAARLPDRAAAGKTGTTQDHRDALFVGYAGELVAGVWVGNDDDSPTKGVSGSNLPAQIWRAVMESAPAPQPVLVARAEPGPVQPREDNGLAVILDWIGRTLGGSN